MPVFSTILRILGFTPLIKIEGKSSFDELGPEEFGELIDSFLCGGNESFDKIAFNEFLHWKVTSPLALHLQKVLSEHSFLPPKDMEYPPINEPYLRQLSSQLKSGEFP